VRASFLASGRTYGARRIWRDLVAEGMSCGLHRIDDYAVASFQGPTVPASAAA
jgi:hypothetical protein